jgi:hypothetical protein
MDNRVAVEQLKFARITSPDSDVDFWLLLPDGKHSYYLHKIHKYWTYFYWSTGIVDLGSWDTRFDDLTEDEQGKVWECLLMMD